ncbi:MAG: ribonuclease Z [Thermoplasmatota archaeon]
MRIHFLGTGGSWPSRTRNSTSIGVTMGRTTVLLDCGEGTQRQIIPTAISPMKIKAILITHLHGDHFLGVPGLVQTMSLNDRNDDLLLIGPRGISESWEKARMICPFTPRFEVIVRTMVPGDSLNLEEMLIEAGPADHSIPSISFRISGPDKPGRFNRDKALELGIPEGRMWGILQKGDSVAVLVDGEERIVKSEDVLGPPRKGLSLVYSGDTAPCEGIRDISKGADVLIHEATFSEEFRELADEYKHSTAQGAAGIARDAGVRKLFLVHISPRYSDEDSLEILLKEASAVFPDVLIPDDLETFEITR